MNHLRRRPQSTLARLLGLGTLYGVITGVVLGLFLKVAEQITTKKVYTLLLNIDFIPSIPQPLPEWIEFALHLIVAVVLAIVYVWLVSRFAIIRGHYFVVGLSVGIMTIPAFFPLTALSDRTPATDDWVAFGWWTAGHLLYGALLGLCGRFVTSNESARSTHPHP